MVAIGNVKLGMRIEPIYVHELSREEVSRILQANGISLNQEKVKSTEQLVTSNDLNSNSLVLQKGKKVFLKVIFE